MLTEILSDVLCCERATIKDTARDSVSLLETNKRDSLGGISGNARQLRHVTEVHFSLCINSLSRLTWIITRK